MNKSPQQNYADVSALPCDQQVQLFVDGHVHVHPCFDEERFLAAACENLSRFGEGVPVLMLVEMAGNNVFARWSEGRVPWTVARTDEAESLWLENRLLVIAGRQVVTKERIEVLGMLTSKQFSDGKSMEQTVTEIEDAGSVAVLPWGAGKWIARRGRQIVSFIENHEIFLGDNAGRPIGWPEPALFQKNLLLCGSDPLRLKSNERTVGSYGFKISCPMDREYPARSIREALFALKESPEVIGRRTGFLGFLRQQIGLRIVK